MASGTSISVLMVFLWGDSRGLKVVDKNQHNFDELIEQELILTDGNNLVRVTVVDNQGIVLTASSSF